MSLLSRIDGDPCLFGMTRLTCEENDSLIAFCDDLLEKQESGGGFRVLKLDDYYSTQRMATPPPSPDCLVIVEDGDNYRYYLVELKAVSRPRGLKPLNHIYEKFCTGVRFLTEEYPHVFCAEEFAATSFECWLVLAGFGDVPNDKFTQRMSGTVADGLASYRPLVFAGIASTIVPRTTRSSIC